jgi:hypothetical protein
MANRCYGKLAPLAQDPRRLKLSAYLTAALPAAPVSCNQTAGITNWGMMLNDRLGDCTIAGIGHAKRGLAAVAQKKTIVVPDSSIQTAYSAVSGYNPVTGANDNGALISAALEYDRTVGVGGYKNQAYGAIGISSLDRVKQAIYYFGAALVGVNLPNTAEQQTDAGQAWTVPWFYHIVGGHCVLLVAYDADWFWAVTWGALQGVTPEFLSKFLDEAWAIVDPLFIEATGESPSLLNVTQLVADLPAIAAS